MWPPTGDLACNPDTFPDWELNWQPFGSQPVLNPLSHASQGHTIYFKTLNLDSQNFDNFSDFITPHPKKTLAFNFIYQCLLKQNFAASLKKKKDYHQFNKLITYLSMFTNAVYLKGNKYPKE